MRNIKTGMAVLAAVATFGLWATTDATYQGINYSTQGGIVLGEWTSQFEKARAYSEEHDIPMFAFWGNRDCVHCKNTEKNMAGKTFTDWQAKRGLVMVFCVNKVTDTKDANKAYSFLSSAGNSFPFAGVYWKGHNIKQSGGKWYEKACFVASDWSASSMISKIESYLAGYTYALNSNFGFEECAGDRYEIESGTTSLDVNLVRSNGADPLNESLVVVGPDGKTKKATNAVAWSAGETAKTVKVAIDKSWCTADGQQLTLQVVNDKGEAKATAHATFVKKENSAANPDWIGEKLEFGRWTTDIDGAKQYATDNGGYTLVSVQGSMWCPDCANTDRNFLDLEEAGVNRFKAWAKGKKVALVTMDIPNYTGQAVTNRATPTLFSKEAYATALARASEHPASGADASLTNKIVRSGRGWLSRKGVSEAKAQEMLEKFHDLALMNTDAGGFHRPEDGNVNRTGVPIFVLLKGDKVVARFTRFAAVSPMASDQANFANYIKRFEEMITLAENDPTEIENNYPGDGVKLEMAANGGKLTSTLCNADFQDAVKLTGLTGGARQKVSINGTSAAGVTVQLYYMTADGKVRTVGASHVCAKLSTGMSFTEDFSEKGTYFVLVKGRDITSPEFSASSATANNFVTYELSGETVYVPSDTRANGVANGEGKATVALTRGEIYMFDGIDEDGCTAALTPIGDQTPHKYFVSQADGETALPVLGGAGKTFAFQIWHSGEVGFAVPANTVPESVNDRSNDWVKVAINRTGGASGWVKIRVALDAAATSLTNYQGVARYELLDVEEGKTSADYEWYDGESEDKIFRVRVLDDVGYDGDGKVALNVEVLSSEAGDVTVAAGKDAYALNVTEDDKADVGKATVTRVEPYWGKALTVYAREGEGAKIWAKRVVASDGLAGVEVKSSLSGVTFATQNPLDLEDVYNAKTKKTQKIFWWSHREMDEKYLHVKGIPAGKTAKVTLNAYEGFKTVSGSNSVTVVSVADDAPYFATDDVSATIYRYVAFSNTYEVASQQGGALTFAKLSGSLPAGLSVKYDAASKKMAVFGVPTTSDTKKGVKRYEAVYQVAEARPVAGSRSTKKVAGLTIRLTFDVVDPALAGGTGSTPLNGFFAKTRTYSDIPVVETDVGTLIGTLQVTIPQTGKASAKLLCSAGTISFSAKSFEQVQESGNFVLIMNPTSKTYEGMTLGIDASPQGELDIAIVGLSGSLSAQASAPQWSSTASAKRYQGQYTIAMPVHRDEQGEEDIDEGITGLAPRGTPYLTLKMTSSSQWNAGKMTWAGALANGTAISGTAVLTEKVLDDGSVAVLPIVKQSKTDFFSALPRLLPDAKAKAESQEEKTCYQTIESPKLAFEKGEGGLVEVTVRPWWSHAEGTKYVPDAVYSVVYDLYGSIYDLSHGLDCCCQAYVGTTNLQLTVEMPLPSEYYGALGPVAAPMVTVTAKTVSVMKNATNPQKLTLSLNSSGVVSGSFKLPYVDENGKEKTLSATYKGVVLIGWSSSCGCATVNLPFIHGAWTFADKLGYEAKSGTKTVTKYISVKRGDVIQTDVTTME